LPTSKAIEIAWKSIRLRLNRSLLVTSGIVLALAFLMYILSDQALMRTMRLWAQSAAASPRFVELRQKQAQLEAQLKIDQAPLLSAATAARDKPGPKPQAPFDAAKTFGRDWAALQQELGALPLAAAELNRLLGQQNELIQPMGEWIHTQRTLHQVTEQLAGPQRLQAMLRTHGQAATDAEAAKARIQTRWLLGLALLVAFVGILNAMLMSVTERFREIGTMKCLGALDSFIIKLFLIESLFQGLVGTAFGVAGGLLLSLAGAASAYGRYAWQNVPWTTLGYNALECLAVGTVLTIAGALYPAWQAARMQPIEAMRAEA
jgi:hypothetical protein